MGERGVRRGQRERQTVEGLENTVRLWVGGRVCHSLIVLIVCQPTGIFNQERSKKTDHVTFYMHSVLYLCSD